MKGGAHIHSPSQMYETPKFETLAKCLQYEKWIRTEWRRFIIPALIDDCVTHAVPLFIRSFHSIACFFIHYSARCVRIAEPSLFSVVVDVNVVVVIVIAAIVVAAIVIVVITIIAVVCYCFCCFCRSDSSFPVICTTSVPIMSIWNY